MAETVIKVENLSKAYQLGQIGTGTISRDIERFVTTKIFRKEDPFLKIGETNDRSTKGTSDIVWSLKDINFDIKQGDAVGIIGKNGAGKSTLLKLLSRVTSPTSGTIKIKGRIASLLEVGTGFHPELSGKENIYLNGAILGMRKKEITRKLDEIIDFSGVERYIDTPVKRYSSGMYVRLAFAVAAHLESEILIVDEVLAVGDAEFQKKCLGKMGDISKGEGRTVLFVSHNMSAVKSLCNTGVVLENGKILFSGTVQKSVDNYLISAQDSFLKALAVSNDTKQIRFLDHSICINGKTKIDTEANIEMGDYLTIRLKFEFLDVIKDVSIAMDIINIADELISHITNEDDAMYISSTIINKVVDLEIMTDKILLIPGKYKINLWFGIGQSQTLMRIENLFIFNVDQGSLSKRTKTIPSSSRVFLPTKWNIT